MTYKFGEQIVVNPTFTVSKGNTVGDFVTVNVNVNSGGSYFKYMLGAMPKDMNMDSWAADQIETYEVVISEDENGNQIVSAPQSVWQVTKNWFTGLFQ